MAEYRSIAQRAIDDIHAQEDARFAEELERIIVDIQPVKPISRPLCTAHGPGQVVPYRVACCKRCAPYFGFIIGPLTSKDPCG